MTNNLFENIPAALPEELFQTLQTSGDVKIERIISRGHTTPEGKWYDQSWDEWVLLLSGSARIVFDGDKEPVLLESGDYLMLPAGLKHRVDWTEPNKNCIWLAIHCSRSV